MAVSGFLYEPLQVANVGPAPLRSPGDARVGHGRLDEVARPSGPSEGERASQNGSDALPPRRREARDGSISEIHPECRPVHDLRLNIMVCRWDMTGIRSQWVSPSPARGPTT
jgi:hypothetical protein